MFNRMAYNPAYAGMDNSLSMTGIYRTQWVGFEGSPTSQHINVHAPLPFVSSGFGISFQNDVIGAFQNMNFQAAYNYQLPVGRTGTLALGIGGGILQQNLNGSVIRTPEGEYTDVNIPNHKDNLLSAATFAANAPNIQAGIYYKSELFEAGLAVQDILEQAVPLELASIKPLRTYFFNATANLDLNRSLTFHPSVFIKSDLIETQMDFSVMFSYNDNISLGTSFRGYNSNSIDATAIIGGVKLNDKMRVYYSYDITLSELRTISTGSHEVMLNYNLNKEFGKGVPPQIIYNPRNL